MNLFKKNKTIFLILFSLFILASFLRLYKLDTFPVGFHQDEASLGYNAYSILQTGNGENGHFLPLYIDTFGDFRPTGYNYFDIIPIEVFGLTEFATRIPAAVFGIFSIFAIYVLTYSLFKNKAISLISAAIIAIEPWHINLSRASAEAIIALFFIMLGFAGLVYSIRNKNVRVLVLSSLSLCVSFFFYHTPRVFVPLLFLMIFIFGFNFIKKQNFLKPAIMAFIFISAVSLFLVFNINGGTGRYTQVNIFTYPETQLVTNEQIKEDGLAGLSPFVARIFHNKLVNYSKTIATNYFDYFTGKFLFMEGGLPIWYKVPAVGLLYLLELPFIIFGIYYLIRRNSFESKVIFLWVLVSPIVASITFDDIPNINRAIVLFPALNIISSFGIYNFVNNFRSKRFLYGLLIALFTLSLFYFLHQYFVNAKEHRTWYRNNGVKEMMSEVMKSYGSYDHVVITKSAGGIYPLVLFYSHYDPARYQREGSTKNDDYTGFGKFFFVPQDCPSVNRDSRFPDGRNLYVDNGTCPLVDGQNYKIINREDGTPGFRIVYGTN